LPSTYTYASNEAFPSTRSISRYLLPSTVPALAMSSAGRPESAAAAKHRATSYRAARESSRSMTPHAGSELRLGNALGDPQPDRITATVAMATGTVRVIARSCSITDDFAAT
jgi:hypothetical protein